MNEKLNVQFIIFFLRDFFASAHQQTLAGNKMLAGKNNPSQWFPLPNIYNSESWQQAIQFILVLLCIQIKL